MAINVGDIAPDFEGTTDSGKKIKFSEFAGKGNVVLYFYPKDETPGCTAEACAFRDEWDEFEKMNAKVIGISSDSPESHRKFKEHRKLPFTLISDPDQKIREMYGAKGRFIPPRISFVIVDGKIVNIYNSQMNATNHVKIAKEVLSKIGKDETNQ
jgi:peroxiredoxin Q/BCP